MTLTKVAQNKDTDDLWKSIFIFGYQSQSKAVKLFMEESGIKAKAYYCSTFQGIIKGTLKMSIARWAMATMASEFDSIEVFAKGIMNDCKAVSNAIKYTLYLTVVVAVPHCGSHSTALW